MPKSGRGPQRTQYVVITPAFRRGVASIMDLRGQLAMSSTTRRLNKRQDGAAALRADHRHIAKDFEIVAPPRMTRRRAKEIVAAASR